MSRSVKLTTSGWTCSITKYDNCLESIITILTKNVTSILSKTCTCSAGLMLHDYSVEYITVDM